MTEIGPNFGNFISDVVDEPMVMDVGGLKLEKMLYNFDSVATGNAEGVGNRLVLDYDVAFNNIHENVDASGEYFVTSGVAIYNAAGDQVYGQKSYPPKLYFPDRVCLGFPRDVGRSK